MLQQLDGLGPYLRLKERLVGDGWTPGATDPRTWRSGTRSVLRRCCPRCRWRGLGGQVFSRGEQVRLLAVCPCCATAALGEMVGP